MTSAFQLVVAEIKTHFDAVRVISGRSSPWPAANWFVGRLAVKSKKSPPYIGWVRGAGGVRPPQYLNPICGTTDQGVLIKPLYDMPQSVMAHICGATEEDTENLHKDVLRAVASVLGPSAAGARGYDWVTQREEDAAYAYAGVELVMQQFEWAFICEADRSTLSTITTFPPPTELLVPSEV